ncbi:hypothetical protein BBJ28_00014581 [Nothophytophthora sp. Chile5]|nr:hypothetical protein BBJ28_00014581 [Nothophytophthora sp. Chile5]
MATPCGFLSVRKPAGVTSTQCVRVVRSLFDTKQVGHGGTLDPMATGVLIMALGRATRVLPHLTTGKEYRGVIRFGVTTDTDDITGWGDQGSAGLRAPPIALRCSLLTRLLLVCGSEILTKRAAPWLTPALVDATLQRFVGNIDQMPPRISAIKRNGVRLYHLTRANKARKA